MALANPAKFIREVRNEMAKVTWPTRKETTVTTIMVLVLVMLAAIFFFITDWVVGHVVKLLLGFGG